MKWEFYFIIILILFSSCSNPTSNENNTVYDPINNDSCGFGIITVVNNSWNNYRVLVDDVLMFTVKFKSSNGSSIPLDTHNIKVGTPGNYVLDTTFCVKDCRTYVFYCW